MKTTAVSTWFGAGFRELDPLLQRVHLDGATLSGPVEVGFGSGFAGVVGRRLAGKLGVPKTGGPSTLKVSISHDEGVLRWSREFDGGSRMLSLFRPVGSYPNGYWVEETGNIHLQLGVDVLGGGWYWRQQRTFIGPIPLPAPLVPVTSAHKVVEDGHYRFSVRVVWPPLGSLLWYSGLLDVEPVEH